MNGIQTQEVFEGTNDSSVCEFKVKLEGKWFKVTWTERPVLDGRFAHSSNVHKWDCIGTDHEFKIEPTEGPEKELPSEVQRFVERYQETGKSEGIFMEIRQDLERSYPGHKWGWVDERFKHDYVC
ncbi:MAG: hypothetical protein COV91_01135 [Candidatus Taylorbacteria bacterium CG11_big_fil_rev_8_21_14_0_20_46_11]|uniref:Uncharacterized protein n=1 Tax=Candidatus Taylorbacteria bacterium CG11_big_fil_rev_8_21_14_0_20_46_11 TaxID=1975025 RepID=A0A2H0KEF5_9BACT|nr:MAG: hypothetical protein COV91_01135 [Candidatus Taylorbacteria bacterium CG11_big_fil_rev_8_21_14_0_20_46_11]